MPPSSSSPAMAAGDHQHQAATTQCFFPGNACLPETHTGYRWPHAAEPGITFLPFLPGECYAGIRSLLIGAGKWCFLHGKSPAPASTEHPAMQGSKWTAPIPERCWEHQHTQDPQGDKSTDLISSTFLIPDTFGSAFLTLNYTIKQTSILEKVNAVCQSPRTLTNCAKNNLHFCFYRIQGPISINYRLRKRLLIFQEEKKLFVQCIINLKWWCWSTSLMNCMQHNTAALHFDFFIYRPRQINNSKMLFQAK